MPRDRHRWLIPLAFLGFVSLGLPDGILGVAWPSIRRSFERPVDHLGLILLATMAGYLASSFAGGALVAQLGVGRLLTASGLLVAASAAAWAATPAWPPVLAGALASGLGAGAIDAGINAFAAARFSPRVITWLHACWGLGAMLGPLGMTAALASGGGWRAGYAGLAASLLALAACFHLTLELWNEPGTDPAAGLAAVSRGGVLAGLREALGDVRVRANVLVFFLYTGLEAAAGQWTYTLLTESRGLGSEAAGIAASLYWGSIFVGRIGFGALAHHVTPALVLRLTTASAPVLALALWLSRGPAAAFLTLFALGLVLAPIFPLLISETPARVGERHAAHAIGFQVAAATLGAGTLPALAGVLMRGAGLEALGPFLLVDALLLLAARRLGSASNGAASRPSAADGATGRSHERGSRAPRSRPPRRSRA